MPYEFSRFTLPSGVPAIRSNASGVITREDVAHFMDHVDRGRPYFGMPLLCTTYGMEEYTAEARRAFAQDVETSSDMGWCAMVMSNPVLRVVLNFLMRVNRHPKLRIFGKEEEALRWLDERVREDSAKRAT